MRCKAWVCGRSLVRMVGSNPAGDMDVYPVSVVYCQVEVSALPSVVCLSVIQKPQQYEGLDPLGLSSHEKKTIFSQLFILFPDF
jgi:hypothetical protein